MADRKLRKDPVRLGAGRRVLEAVFVLAIGPTVTNSKMLFKAFGDCAHLTIPVVMLRFFLYWLAGAAVMYEGKAVDNLLSTARNSDVKFLPILS